MPDYSEALDVACFVVIVILASLLAIETPCRANPQSPRQWCEDTCLVLDMEYAGVNGCSCFCKDVDGTPHREEVPECP